MAAVLQKKKLCLSDLICSELHSLSSKCFTYSVLEVSVTYQFEVLFHSLSGERVLPKDQVLAVHESIHLTHRHVRQELLRRDYICSSAEYRPEERTSLWEGIEINGSHRELKKCTSAPGTFDSFTFVFPVL